MIGIKGMELPKSCKECAFCEEFCEEKFCQMESVSIKDENIRQSFCPLVDLGKEDMSWEELVEKVNKISDPFSKNFTIDDRSIDLKRYNIVFMKNGDIGVYYDGEYISYITNEKRVNYTQMHQIIKSLVGDER